MIEVIRPGALLTVQDLGRPGYAHLGVPRSGAADRMSLRRANQLVGNDAAAAGLEISLGRVEFRFGADAVIAVTGAPLGLQLDGRPAAFDAQLQVAAGQRLCCAAPEMGLRSYLAVAGGLDVPAVMGSRASDLLSALGPAPLRQGDVLAIGSARGWPASAEPAVIIAPHPLLEFHPGPRADCFDGDALRQLCAAEYEVGPDSNRVGLRLTGVALRSRLTGELPSEGIAHGAIQVPANGQPLIFLADHPTTGGYPCIGVLRPESLARAAQLRPGDRLSFAMLSAGDCQP